MKKLILLLCLSLVSCANPTKDYSVKIGNTTFIDLNSFNNPSEIIELRNSQIYLIEKSLNDMEYEKCQYTLAKFPNNQIFKFYLSTRGLIFLPLSNDYQESKYIQFGDDLIAYVDNQNIVDKNIIKLSFEDGRKLIEYADGNKFIYRDLYINQYDESYFAHCPDSFFETIGKDKFIPITIGNQVFNATSMYAVDSIVGSYPSGKNIISLYENNSLLILNYQELDNKDFYTIKYGGEYQYQDGILKLTIQNLISKKIYQIELDKEKSTIFDLDGEIYSLKY